MAYRTAHDLKQFYAGRTGRMIRRVLAAHIRMFWPDIKGESLLGLGYAAPFLTPFRDEAERVSLMIPAERGVHFWPADSAGLVCLGDEQFLPFESESLDRILLIHGLETFESAPPALHEIWRVLRGGGRLLLIVPNRLGFWARAEWSPFGEGTPYTAGQLSRLLRENRFNPERTGHALFLPPAQSPMILRSLEVLERIGPYMFPALSGVTLIEASKQIYCGTGLMASAPAVSRRAARNVLVQGN
jgi:SAM-dependent methyltransferase